MAAFEARARAVAAALAVLVLPGCALDDDRTLHPAATNGDAGAGGDETLTGSGSGGNGGSSAASDTATSDAGGSSNNAGGASTGATTGTVPASDCPDLNQNEVPDCDETLVGNATFDAGTENWEAETTVEIHWEEAAAAGAGSAPSSGTLVVTHDGAGAPDQLTMAGGFQCISVQGQGSYRFLAQSFIRADHDGAAAAISALFYGSSDCSGSSLSVSNSPVQATADSWRVLHTGGVSPELARSVRVRLVALKARADDAVEVRFDNVLVIRD